MGRHFREERYQLHPRPSRTGVVRRRRQDYGAQVALQGLLLVLQVANHGRGTQHDPSVPEFDQIQERGGEEEVLSYVSLFLLPFCLSFFLAL